MDHLGRHTTVFQVTHANIHVFCNVYDEQKARERAARYLGGYPDTYIVTPLTKPGDRVMTVFTMFV